MSVHNITSTPIIPWIGGKRRLAKEIIPLFPEHKCYVEPFCGAAAIFFLKQPSKTEVINDINGDVINLYRVVQHHLEEFVRQFKWALCSREIFKWLQDTPIHILTDIDDLIAVDLHASQIQGFYNIPVDHLHAMPILAQYFLDNGIASKDDDDVVVVSPDHSGAKLARTFGSYFDAPIAIVDQRGARYDAEAHDMIGDVKDKTVIIVDDLIDTGSRIASSTKSVLAAGAKKVYVAATHALLSQNAIDVLNELPVEQIVVTDTIKHKKYPDRMVRLSVARLLAKGIDYIYNDKSIHQIFDEQNRIQG